MEPEDNEVSIKVLLIEDDERLGQLTGRYLETHGLLVTLIGNGADGEAEALRRQYDCILLDVMLPDCSGVQVCRHLRTRIDVPVIMITALGDDPDVVVGLEAGADDYIAKPLSGRTLLARIRAVVRRARGRVGPQPRRLRLGTMTIDAGTMRATRDGIELDLTPSEFAILRVLADHAGRVLSREQLLDLAKGGAELSFERSIDAHVSRLRAKLGDDARNPRLLKTIRGSGYLFTRED
jgi:two-component system, OmpR family, response regulator